MTLEELKELHEAWATFDGAWKRPDLAGMEAHYTPRQILGIALAAFAEAQKPVDRTEAQYIVCAANRLPNGHLLLGARHWDQKMRDQYKLSGSEDIVDFDNQGFMDQRGNFLTRTEAWKVAEKAGQIRYRCGGDEADGGTLYSENLY